MKIFIYDEDESVKVLHSKVPLLPNPVYLRGLKREFAKFATQDPANADYFFVPLSLISLQFAEKEPAYQQECRRVKDYLLNLPHLGRAPHLLYASGDFGQRKKSVYESHSPNRAYPHIYDWLDDRFSLIAFESTADLWPQDFAFLPYSLIESSKKFDLMRRIASKEFYRPHRDLLYSFSGTLLYSELGENHIRGGKLLLIKGKSRDTFVATPKRALLSYGPLRGSDIGIIKRSVFTLCPAGYGRWSFRWMQALRFGSIPVIFSDGYVKPFAQFVNWKRYCFHLPESDVANIDDILRSVPEEQISQMKSSIEAGRNLWMPEGTHDLLLKAMQERIATLN